MESQSLKSKVPEVSGDACSLWMCLREGEEEYRRTWLEIEASRKMEDFKDGKIEEMVVITEEWLGWLLECLQQLNGGRKVVWWLLKGFMAAGILAAAKSKSCCAASAAKGKA
ncbi:hypothetical protein L3X38_034377 [Prunus dulcis]|uniref:Uncharacterized protein n=1 Tax=Prunus dulcis TaxID=3755 RepID=A0AAD4VJ51_PRUDU|nr:hypothetical protein L3X38_034377 [Prunus dulcis]